MIATGIVRRVDDLGRIIIPKEIRKILNIREGDPLEIFTTKEGEVVFKKYETLDLNKNDLHWLEVIIDGANVEEDRKERFYNLINSLKNEIDL
jgi:AbrB family transcriptional regulator (stage V sporulation protein T)